MKRIAFIFLVILWFTSCQESPLEDSISEVTTESELDIISRGMLPVERIFAFTSPLTSDQKLFLFRCLQSLEEKYPELEDVISYIVDNRGPILFKMNPYLDADAAYDSYTIEFRDEFCIEDERVLEEILHAAQDIAYGYEMIRFSRKNVEFEVRVLRDIWEYRRALREGLPIIDLRGSKLSSYRAWIFSLTLQNLLQASIPQFNELAEGWHDPLYDGPNLFFNPDFTPRILKYFASSQL